MARPRGWVGVRKPRLSFPKLKLFQAQGANSKSQEVSLGEKMKKGRWRSTELNGHEDLVLDCDLDVQLGLAVTCSRDTTVKVS